MKTSSSQFVSLLLALGLALLSSARAELLVWQDFNSAPSIASLVDTGSSDTSRFYAIATTSVDADNFSPVQSGDAEERRLDGIGTVGIVGGKLKFSLLGAWRTFITGGSSPFRFYDTFTSTGEIARLFPVNSRPNLLFWRFKMNSKAVNVSNSLSFVAGATHVNFYAGKPLFELFVDGENRLRFVPGIGSDLIFEDEVEITVLINKTAAPMSYGAPDETEASVGASAYDVWVNDTLIVEEGAHPANTPINNVQTNFVARINADSPSGIPYDPGPPFEFELDDILMRSDFDQIVPAGAAVMALSGNLNFGTKKTGSRSRKNLLIRNTGTIPMTVSRLRFPNTAFRGAFLGTIPGGGVKAVSVTFQPRQARTFRGAVSVISTAANSPGSLPISGTGRKR